METIGARIRYVRKATKLSQEKFAASLGVSRGAVGNWELDKDISRENLQAICKIYGVSLDWLAEGKGQTPTPEGIGSENPSNAIIGDRLPLSPGPKIPLYGQAVAGIHGEFVLNGTRLDDITAPPSLSGIDGAYAVMVSGDSMYPRYEDGETLFVDPRKRVRHGDYVVAQIQKSESGPKLAYIKRFVRHNAKELVLEQLNPVKELFFPHEQVVSVDYVVLGGHI